MRRSSPSRLTLHQTGWGDPRGADGAEWDAAYRSFDRAWSVVLGNLQARDAPDREPKDWSAWLEQLKAR